MGKIELFELEKLRAFKWVGPHYYDHPDGEDLAGKLQFTTTLAGAAGLLVGAVAPYIKPIPKTLVDKLIRSMRCVVPCVGSAMTFTVVTYYSTKIRGKDDEFNYCLGGFLSGAVLAALGPSRDLGVFCTLIFPFLGYYKKSYQLEGKTIIQPFAYQKLPNYYRRKIDYTLTPEKPATWTKGPAAEKEKAMICTEK